MVKKIICIFVCLLFICLIPTTIGSEEESSPLGYGPWTVIGLFPSKSGDYITCFLIGPFMGKTALNKGRFNGHVGLIFLIGKYQWFANGPPMVP